MPFSYKKSILVGALCFIMLFSSFSIYLNNFKGVNPTELPQVNTEKLPNNEITTETAPLISDNFENYSSTAQLNLSWPIGSTSGCSVDLATDVVYSPSQSVKFTDAGTGIAQLRKSLGDKREVLYLSFYLYASQRNSQLGCYIYNQSGGAGVAAVVGFWENGYIFYTGRGGGWRQSIPYDAGKWYHFEVLLDIAGQSYTLYVDNSEICMMPTYEAIRNVYWLDFETSPPFTGIFYLDDVLVRDWFIKNQYNVTQQGGKVFIDDNFNSYANDAAVRAAGWQYNMTMNTFVNLVSYPPNAHSYPKSIQLYDNNATSGIYFSELKKNFTRTSSVYFRVYIKPAQTDRTLMVRVGYDQQSGSGIPFPQGGVILFRDNGMIQSYSWNDPYHDRVSYKANQWYKIEIFASGAQQRWSLRVNDTWLATDIALSYQNIKNFSAISITTAGSPYTGIFFYVDDVFVANQSDSIIYGTPLNGFNEKQLLDVDTNYQTIQSVNVGGKQTVAAVYQYNFSEYPPAALYQTMIDYAYETAANKTQARSQITQTTSDFSSWTLSNTIKRTTGLMLNVHECNQYTFPAAHYVTTQKAQESGSWMDTYYQYENLYWMIQTTDDWTISWMQLSYNNPNSARAYKLLHHGYNLRFASQYNDPGYLSITDISGYPYLSGNTFTKAKVCLPRDNIFHSGFYDDSHPPNYEAENLGAVYTSPMIHIAWRYQRDWFDDTWLSWDYSGIMWYWDEYYTSGTATKTFDLSGDGSFKQLNNITYTANIPSGCSVGLEYNANTPKGWTGWRSTANGGRINVLANQIQVRLTLTPEASLKQITPRIMGMIINYGEPANISSTLSFYNYQSSTWIPVLTTTGFGIQTVQKFVSGLRPCFNSKSILQAKIVTTTTEAPQMIFSINRLFIRAKPEFYLVVDKQEENSITMVQNNSFVSGGAPYIVSYFDFPIKISYYTKIGFNYLTWTNATLFYRINSGPWKPYFLGKDFGNITRTICIKEGNYTTNANLSYYLYFEQYDSNQSQSTLLAKYYWTRNGIKTTQADAQNYAFRKRVLSILYGLTLKYSFFSRAQLPALITTEMGVNTTIYPWRRVDYQNFSVSFFNTSSSQNLFNVRISNETLLNHTVEEYSRNISSSFPTYFPLTQGIKSPFALSLDTPYNAGSQIEIPLIAFTNYTLKKTLNFPGTKTLANWSGRQAFPYPNRTVISFLSNNLTIRYDANTGIMVYYEYRWGGINSSRKMVLALIDNNKNYSVNLWIDKRWEANETGSLWVAKQPLFILYDPPGDNSYSQISMGTTLTFGVGFEVSNAVKLHMESETYVGGFGGGGDWSASVKLGIGYDMQVELTTQRTFTSSMESQNGSLVGPGRGDLYYAVGYVINWTIYRWNFYIVVNSRDLVGRPLDDIRVWENGSKIVYGVNLSSPIAVLAAYLPMYGLSNLNAYNIFADNVISPQENSSVFYFGRQTWTPAAPLEFGYSLARTTSVKVSLSIEVSMDIFFGWDRNVDVSMGEGVSVGTTVFQSRGKVGISTEFSMDLTLSSSTTVNKEVKCHLEDDDGTPIGQQDEFVTDIYYDLRYGTFGFISWKGLTYTSRPYEAGYSRDRRPPVQSEIFNMEPYLRGTEFISCAALDEETGVNNVKFYYDTKPTLDEFSQFIGYQINPTTPGVYKQSWDTIGLHGTFYVWAVVYDDATPVWNSLASEPYQVHIDNVLPRVCELRAYGPYRQAIRLYANAFDADSGILYVEYWDGPPTNSSSHLLGTSYDSSSSFQYIWATDSNYADDGLHFIYARAFDRAGNYLDSSAVQITVDNSPIPPAAPPSTALEDGLLIALLAIGIAGVAAYILNTTVFKRRVGPEPLSKKEFPPTKPPKGA